MATLVVWVLLDYFRTGRATAVGGATGIVVGLVAITPAAGFVSPTSALALGALAAFPSYFAIVWRSRTRLDDSLDVFAGHGIGGITGALLTGVFARRSWNRRQRRPARRQPGPAGQAGARRRQLDRLRGARHLRDPQAASALVTALRAAPRAEGLGMDVTQHGEEAYTNGEGAILVMPDAAPWARRLAH